MKSLFEARVHLGHKAGCRHRCLSQAVWAEWWDWVKVGRKGWLGVSAATPSAVLVSMLFTDMVKIGGHCRLGSPVERCCCIEQKWP